MAAGETEADFANAIAGMTAGGAAGCDEDSEEDSEEDSKPRHVKVALTEEERAQVLQNQRDLRKANKKAVKQENKVKRMEKIPKSERKRHKRLAGKKGKV